MSTEQAESTELSPSMQLMQLLWPGAIALQAVHVAADLGLADLVETGPKTAAELANATKADAPSLERLLRGLSSLGVFAEDSEGRYCQTALSGALRADIPGSIRPWAMMLGAGFVWQPTGQLGVTVRTGRTAFEHVFGAPFFKYLAEHKDEAAIFNRAMSSLPAYIKAIAEAYDFSTFERIVDVGGGHGALLAGILSAHPHVRGVLHDLPEVVAGVPAQSRKEIADRLEVIGGDFFESVPEGADAYLLRGIIHDWNDESATKILMNCRRAIRPNGRLIVIDHVLSPSSDPDSALMDLLMMVLTSGRERTESEFRSLLHDAGFSLTQVIPTMGTCLLECRPI